MITAGHNLSAESTHPPRQSDLLSSIHVCCPSRRTQSPAILPLFSLSIRMKGIPKVTNSLRVVKEKQQVVPPGSCGGCRLALTDPSCPRHSEYSADEMKSTANTIEPGLSIHAWIHAHSCTSMQLRCLEIWKCTCSWWCSVSSRSYSCARPLLCLLMASTSALDFRTAAEQDRGDLSNPALLSAARGCCLPALCPLTLFSSLHLLLQLLDLRPQLLVFGQCCFLLIQKSLFVRGWGGRGLVRTVRPQCGVVPVGG